jgi:hypothetical protein
MTLNSERCSILLFPLSKINFLKVLVAHAYNPSYSVCRDQEDCSLKPAEANYFQNPIMKKTLHKKGLVQWLMVLMYRPWVQAPVLPKIHFFISVTTGKDMNVKRKNVMTKSWNECLETRIMGTIHELNKKFCVVLSHPSCCIHYACSFRSKSSFHVLFPYKGWNSGPIPWASPPAHFVCVCVCVCACVCEMGCFWDGSLINYFTNCIWIVILLISAFWVARTTGLRHQHLGSIWPLRIRQWTSPSSVFSGCLWLFFSTNRNPALSKNTPARLSGWRFQ